MVLARQPPASSGGRGGRGFRDLLQGLVASTFGVWTRARHGVKLGPGLGFVSEGIIGVDLRQGLPDSMPSQELIDGRAASSAYDSGPTEELRRANVWAAALETVFLRGHRTAPRDIVVTTYGFVRVDGAIRMSVVHYLRPLSAYLARRQPPIFLGGWRFPVVIRPWLITRQAGVGVADGNCWVSFGGDGRGVLTAAHAVPEGSRPRDRVSLSVSRSPASGVLRHMSDKTNMDAAVIEIDDDSTVTRVPNSSVIGFKPVQIVTGRGIVLDAQVLDRVGTVGPIIFAESGREPRYPAHLILNRHAFHGDSGCLIVDCEFARFGQEPLPYMMYLGRMNLGWNDAAGFGLMLEQPRIVWNLEFLRRY